MTVLERDATPLPAQVQDAFWWDRRGEVFRGLGKEELFDRAHPDDPIAQALALHEGTERELMPWYVASVVADARNRRMARGESKPEDEFLGTILEDVMPAMRTDPALFRAFVRMFNLLAAPESLMPDPDLGPPREEMLAALGLAAA